MALLPLLQALTKLTGFPQWMIMFVMFEHGTCTQTMPSLTQIITLVEYRFGTQLQMTPFRQYMQMSRQIQYQQSSGQPLDGDLVLASFTTMMAIRKEVAEFITVASLYSGFDVSLLQEWAKILQESDELAKILGVP